MNRLQNEQSAYLRSAAHQPIHWFGWGDEAFATAHAQQKPILLDIGAVWCHWCHVMDMESYENDSIAEIINQLFVAIKVDRDERPDVDARYQAAVSTITGQGGWPLTVFLMPDGRVFYGGTYFPPDERYGRPGFPKVLLALADAFKNDPTKVLQNAEEVEKFTRQYLSRSSDEEELSPDLIQSALNAVSREHDVRYGGFGSAPKFPHASAIELLLQKYHATGEQWMIDTVNKTLRSMAKGGAYDQLGGGFHRYSVDEKWIVPHFEKMLYDNAPILSNYVHAFQATGDPFFRLVALDILRYVKEVLSDQAKGGFYASQDADVEFGDDGSYFTWTIDDARAALSPEEFQVAQLRYNIFEQGEMHHDHRQNVLFVDKSPDEIAQLLQKPLNEVILLLEQAKEKLRSVRNKRRAPFVDKTIYASWNGMMVSSFLEAFKAFGDDPLKEFALKSLDRILREHQLESGLITHRASTIAHEAFLDDQVEIAHAALSAFEITSEKRYIDAAKNIVSEMIEQFWDDQPDRCLAGENAEGPSAFNDIPKSAQQVAALKIKNKPITDSPTPGANAVAVLTLLRLEAYTGNEMYRRYAERILRYFAGVVKNQGIFTATYFLALDAFLNPPPHIVVVGPEEDKITNALHQKSLHSYWPLKTVTRIDPKATDSLPPVLATMRDHFSRPAAYVCSRFTCSPPAFSVDQVESALKSMVEQGVTQ